MSPRTLLIIALVAAVASPGPASFADEETLRELEGYWTFDADGRDCSGNDRGLLLASDASIVDGALFISGSQPADEADAAPAYGADEGVFDFGEQDFTIQAWVNYEDVSGEQVLVEKFTGGEGPGWTLTKLADQSLLFYAQPLGSVEVATEFVAGTWYHVIVRRSGTTFTLFINGASAGSQDRHGAINDSPDGLIIGMRNRDDGRGLVTNGRVDDVAIWSRALDDASIAGLYNDGSPLSLLDCPRPALPPSAPENVTVENVTVADDGDAIVSLSWTPGPAVAGVSVLGYNVFVTSPSSESEGKVRGTKVVIENLRSGQEYCFSVVAIGDNKLKSDLSAKTCWPKFFRRGDANGDGLVNLLDALFIAEFEFLGGAEPPCMAAADANADGTVRTDFLTVLHHLYGAGDTSIAAPFPDCGAQVAEAARLSCDSYPPDCEHPPSEATLPPVKALYRLSFEAPPAVPVAGDAVSMDVFVNLRVPNDAVGLVGWSVRVQTGGGSSCRVDEATLDGTNAFGQLDAASFFLWKLSDQNRVVESAVVSSFTTAPTPFSFDESSASILKLVMVAKSVVACSPCTLEFVDPDPIETDSILNLLITRDDRDLGGFVGDHSAIRPAKEELTFQVCSPLPLDEPTRITLEDPDAGRIFCFRPDPDKSVLITVTPTNVEGNGLGANGLYFQWGVPPTRTRFVDSAAIRGQEDQRLVLAESRDEVGYVLVRGTDFSRKPREVTVTVSEVEFAIEGMTARQFGSTPGNLESAIFGAGFGPGTTFRLEPTGDGGVIEPVEGSVALLSDDTAHVTFEIHTPTPGLFDLVATGPTGATTRLPDEFEIVDSDQPGFIEIELISPDLFRADTWRVLIIRFRNGGYQQIEAPILHVEGPPLTTYRLPGGEEYSDSIDFIGIHAGGVAGVLAPGAVGEIPLLFRTEDRGDEDGHVHFNVSTLAPKRREFIDWDAREGLGLSQQTIDQLRTTVGTRWRDYARNLATLSSEMAREGNETASLDDVFNYAVSRVSEEAPESVLRPGSEFATLRATRTLRVVASLDPNDKRGPTGSDGDFLGDPHCVEDTDRTVQLNCGLEEFPYTIHFENLDDQQIGGDIDGDRDDNCGKIVAALEVRIDDVLDVEAFDLSTLRFHEVSFGDKTASFVSSSPYSSWPYFSSSSAPGVSEGYLEIDLDPPEHDPGRQWFVSAEAMVDASGMARWEFSTHDWSTGQKVDSDCEGFLPPGVGGFVSFSVSLSEEARSKDEKTIKNTASIIFDTNELIETCPWENEVSVDYCLVAATLPAPPDDDVAVDVSPTLMWAGGGLGVEYSVFLSKTGEAPELAVDGLTGTGWSPGQLEAGTSYTWKVRSTVGDTVVDSVEWEFTTEWTDDLFIRGDANSDGIVNISDPVTILGYAFRGQQEVKCLDAADADDNGKIQITDPLRVLGWLFKGEEPPRQPEPSLDFPASDCDIDPTAELEELGCAVVSLKCSGS